MRDNNTKYKKKERKTLNDVHIVTVYKNIKFTSKTVTHNIKIY